MKTDKKKKEVNKFYIFQSPIKEMMGLEEGEIKIESDVDIKELVNATEDKNPLFITIEALNPQISKNRKIWTEALIQEVAKQINEKKPDAYLGHLNDEERKLKTPESKTIWIGATVKNIEGKARLFVKGYVLPYAKKLRTYLKAAKTTGKKVAVSVCGVAQQKWNSAKEGYDMYNFILESIDWARPGAEGVVGTTPFVLTQEMKNMEKKDDKKYTMPEENAVSVIREMAKKDEKIQEFKKEIESYKTTIREMIDDYASKKIEEEVKGESIQKVLTRLVIAEMKGKEYTKESVKTVIREIIDSEEGKLLVNESRKNPIVVSPAMQKKVGGRRFIVK